MTNRRVLHYLSCQFGRVMPAFIWICAFVGLVFVLVRVFSEGTSSRARVQDILDHAVNLHGIPESKSVTTKNGTVELLGKQVPSSQAHQKNKPPVSQKAN